MSERAVVLEALSYALKVEVERVVRGSTR